MEDLWQHGYWESHYQDQVGKGIEFFFIIVVAYQYLGSSYVTQTSAQNRASSNDVVQLTLFIFVWDFIVSSHQINDSNSIEANDGWDVWKRNDNIIFICLYI